MTEDKELLDIVINGPFIPTTEVKGGEITKVVPQTLQQLTKRN